MCICLLYKLFTSAIQTQLTKDPIFPFADTVTVLFSIKSHLSTVSKNHFNCATSVTKLQTSNDQQHQIKFLHDTVGPETSKKRLIKHYFVCSPDQIAVLVSLDGNWGFVAAPQLFLKVLENGSIASKEKPLLRCGIPKDKKK